MNTASRDGHEPRGECALAPKRAQRRERGQEDGADNVLGRIAIGYAQAHVSLHHAHMAIVQGKKPVRVLPRRRNQIAVRVTPPSYSTGGRGHPSACVQFDTPLDRGVPDV